MGSLTLDAKKKCKKKKRKQDTDGRSACRDHECCAGATCVSGGADDRCGRFGDPCQDCAQEGRTCDTATGVRTWDRAACAALQQCCDTGPCVDGSTDDNRGDDGGPCEFCVSRLLEQSVTTEEDRLGCCAPQGRARGNQPIIDGRFVVGSKFVPCCAGATCDPDGRTCVERPLRPRECNTDQFCCNHASGDRLGVCMYTTGLKFPTEKSCKRAWALTRQSA